MHFNAFKTLSDDVFTLVYNNQTPEDYGVFCYDYPVISSAEKRRETKNIGGAMGQLVEEEGPIAYNNITIKQTFSVLHKKFMLKVTEIKDWLRNSGTLQFSDTTDRFYEVLYIEHGDIEREIRKYGRFSVTFHCFPYVFMEHGQQEAAISTVKQNPYNIAMPVYTITGNGDCTIAVNGKSLIATVGQTLTIDTRRQIAYKTRNGGYLNTSIKGKYSNLYLPHGAVTITATNGFNVKIQPNWGWIA